MVYGIDGSPFGLHNIMAMPSVLNGADDEQISEWVPKMKPRQVNVCYAQTEIGHGLCFFCYKFFTNYFLSFLNDLQVQI